MKADTVEDTYTIDADTLYTLGQDSEYWKSCEKFFSEVHKKPTSAMSSAQTEWLIKIENGIEEYL